MLGVLIRSASRMFLIKNWRKLSHLYHQVLVLNNSSDIAPIQEEWTRVQERQLLSKHSEKGSTLKGMTLLPNGEKGSHCCPWAISINIRVRIKDTISGEITLSKQLISSKKGSTLKGKNLLPKWAFLFRVDTFSKGLGKHLKQTGS